MAVDFARDGALGYITLDKPPANSYDRAFMGELGRAVDAVAGGDAVKVAIVRSASPKFFCAGAAVCAFSSGDTAASMAPVTLGHEVLARIDFRRKVFGGGSE